MDIYIVFDAPPGENPGRFVEVETREGASVGPSQTGALWIQQANGHWRLGPFGTQEAFLRRALLGVMGVLDRISTKSDSTSDQLLHSIHRDAGTALTRIAQALNATEPEP